MGSSPTGLIFPKPASAATVFVVEGADGRIVSRTGFSTGWRIDLVAALWRDEPNLRAAGAGRHLLEMTSKAAMNGRDVARQFYVIDAGGPCLVRLEDSAGRPLSNVYKYPNHTIGPPPRRRSAAQWESMLASADDDPAVTLEALVWLGGEHRRDPLPEYERDVSMEDAEDAALWATACARDPACKRGPRRCAPRRTAGSPTPRN